MARPPDFVMFTGDLTHTTDDPRERRQRMTEFKEIVGALKVKDVRFMPGEHDASLDNGKAFKEFFGATHYTFEHKGVHFIVIDNVSDPMAAIGDEQLEWLRADLAAQPKEARIVVFTHRPLFDLYPQWDWATRDGARAIELLQTHDNVTVFYGHIHQEHHFMTGNIAHHSAKSLMFALPVAASQPRRLPIPWDAERSVQGPRLSGNRGRARAGEVRDPRIAGGLRGGHATSPAIAAARGRCGRAHCRGGPDGRPGAAQAPDHSDRGAENSRTSRRK